MEKSRDFTTGLLFFGLLAVLGVFTIALAGLRLGPTSELTVSFSDVNGLEVGHDVRVDGFRCGKVRGMEIQPRRARILVTVVFDKKPVIYEGASFSISLRIGIIRARFLQVCEKAPGPPFSA